MDDDNIIKFFEGGKSKTVFDISTESIILDKVSIKNENEYSFPFKSLTFNKNKIKQNYHIIKIDFGDGTKQTYKPTINLPSYYLEINQPDWDDITHEFYFQDDNVTEIKMEFYFLTGDVFTITIPVEVKINELKDIGLNFQLLSANLTNDDRVSYVFKHVDTDSIVIVHTVKEIEKAKRS